MAALRILREIRAMKVHPPPNCRVQPIVGDIFTWKGTIEGPPDTPYQEGVFRIKIQLSRDYPFKPPIIQFLTEVYHLNVSSKGRIVMGNVWSSAMTINNVLASVITLLAHPNLNDPLNISAFGVFKSDIDMYEQNAREWTEIYAEPEIIEYNKRRRII